MSFLPQEVSRQRQMTYEKGCYGRALSPMGADKLPTEIIPFPLRTLKKASGSCPWL